MYITHTLAVVEPLTPGVSDVLVVLPSVPPLFIVTADAPDGSEAADVFAAVEPASTEVFVVSAEAIPLLVPAVPSLVAGALETVGVIASP